jgi:hypothetical protein
MVVLQTGPNTGNLLLLVLAVCGTIADSRYKAKGGKRESTNWWDATVFAKNRNRLLEAEVAKEFLARVVEQAREKGWTSDEHFTVDGTLLEAWASVKSFQPKEKKGSPPPDDPGNPTVNFHGEKRSNQTHESKSDPDALLARKRRRQGGEVELQRKSAGGESLWLDCVEPGVGSHGHRRARCGDGHAARGSGNRARDRERRQGI